MRQQKHPVMLMSTLFFGLLLALIAGLLVVTLPRVGAAQMNNEQATVDAAIQIAFTQTAVASSGDIQQTQSFRQTVEAALHATLTATFAPSPTPTQTPVPPITALLSQSAELGSVAIYRTQGSAFSAADVREDGLIAAANLDGTVTLWDSATNQLVRTLIHDTGVLGVLFHPTAPELISTDANGKHYRWDVSTGERLPLSAAFAQPDSTSQGAIPLDFAPDGSRFASFDFNGALVEWAYPNLQPVPLRRNLSMARLNYGANVFAYTLREAPATMYVERLRGESGAFNVPTDAASVSPVAISADGNRVIFASDTSESFLLDVPSRALADAYAVEGYAYAAYSADGQMLLTGNADGSIVLRHSADGELIRSLSGHSGAVNDIAFDPNGAFFVSASADGTLRQWALNPPAQPQEVAAVPPSPTPIPPTVPAGPTPLPAGFPPVVDAEVQVAEQLYEGGRMFWVQPVNQMWVVVVNDEGRGTWLIYEDTFDETTDPATDPAIIAPEGKIQPERGFGKLWRENPEVREALGWAITPEFGYISRYRYIPGGEVNNGTYTAGPGYHLLLSLGGELFRFNEANSTWQLGE